jgi:hypothetical protein
MRNGQGVFISVKGNVYDGEWKNDQRHGKGQKIYDNGDKYIG